jgi:hypothetical protein
MKYPASALSANQVTLFPRGRDSNALQSIANDPIGLVFAASSHPLSFATASDFRVPCDWRSMRARGKSSEKEVCLRQSVNFIGLGKK